MSYVPKKKGTLLIPTGNVNHLFVIVTEKCVAESSHLLLNVTTLRSGIKHDPTTIVRAGEHPFIKQESYVEYRRALILKADHITKMVVGFVYKPNAEASDSLVEALLDGIEDSDYVAGYVKAYFKKQP